ncbi:FMN-binding protein [Clostridioides difficile]|nr:FMN-binding protein [Clostridioides difficile]
MRKKSKIIAGGILITSVIGATSFAIIDPYNILSNKNMKIPEQSRKLEKSNNKEKEDIDNKKDENNMNLNGIKDGTYLGEAKGYGGNIKVKVIIESGKIKNIEVLSHSETPKYYENGSKVIGNIIRANSTDVDAVSGATLTSNGIKNAVRDAISKAGFNVSKDNKEVSVASNSAKSRPVSSNNMVKNIDLKEYKIKDGEYIGEAIGFKGNVKVKVIISGGKLSDVKVISHNDDAEFFNKAKSVIIKILRNQGTAGVDTVSGATYSSRGIINAVNSALNKVAKESNGIFNTIKIFENDNIPRKDSNPKFNVKDIVKEALHQKSISIDKDDNISSREHKFKDGEYIGEANGFKGNVKVKVIIKNGTLVNIEIINHNDDKEFFNNAKRLIFKILKNQGTTGVDTVSGATYSSKGIINSVNRALNKAVNKNITTQDTIVQSKGDKVKENVDIKDIENPNDKFTQKENQEISKDNKEKESSKSVKYLDGSYKVSGIGFTGKPIKSVVTFENNKIKSIDIGTIESGDFGDNEPFRPIAIKVVDHILSDNGGKSINDLILHGEIVDKIFKSNNYYEVGKNLIGDYAGELKGIYVSGRIAHEKISSVVKKYMKAKNSSTVLDSVSGATFSAIGIAKSVKDAMNKSANDYETDNIVNELKIKTPSEKRIYVDLVYSTKDKKLDLSNLKVIISMRDGKEKEISYDKFKENDIEIHDKETGKAITNGMDLSSYERNHAICAVIEHKNSLNKDKLIIIPEIIDKNYITGMEYSVDNGVTWKNISGLKKMNNSNNIHFNQELKISKEDERKVLLRAVSINGDKYGLNLKEKIEGPNGYCIFEPSKDDKAKNKHVANGFNISFKFTNTTDNNVATSLEKVSYARIYLNDSVIYKQYQGKLKVGQKIDWTGAKFKFKNSEQESIKDLFTEDEIKNLKNSNSYKKEGYFNYEDLEKLGITISPNQNSEVTTDLNVTLTYKGKTFKVKGGGINGDDDFVGIILEKQEK